MKIQLNTRGLIPAICQEHGSGKILMHGYVNEESLNKTFETGNVWFYSRSREKLWCKGETSGNFLKLISISSDCDNDTLLLTVKPTGNTCHTGEYSCFFNKIDQYTEYQAPEVSSGILEEVYSVIQSRKTYAEENRYTARLLEKGAAKIAQKVVEEAGELAIAAVQKDLDNLVEETADLLYHSLVALAEADVPLKRVWSELDRRRRS